MITVNRTELTKALAFASLGLPRYAPSPVMTAMRVTVGAGAVQLGAFDYETCATVIVHGDGDGTDEGEILAFGRELTQAVRSLPATGKTAALVAVAVTATGMTLTCDGWEVTVDALPADAAAEYPLFPPLPPLAAALDGTAFTRAVLRVAECASTDDTLPLLTMVNMTAGAAGTLVMAATDRYRLGVDTQQAAVTAPGTALAPAVLLVQFAKACAKDGKVMVHLGAPEPGAPDADRVAFSDGTRTMITRAGAGEFIRYQGRTDIECPTLVTADAAALAAVVVRAGKVTDRNWPVKFAAGQDGVRLTALRDGKPSGTQLVPATLTGPPQATAFNPGYLAGMLATLSGEVTIGMPGNPKLPVRISSADGFTAILVPQRLE